MENPPAVLPKVLHCPKCLLQYDPVKGGKHCGRCAYDLEIIDITEALVSAEQLKHLAGKKELLDLMQMLRNWSRAFIRLTEQKGVDWSSPHEFLEEYGTQMVPYVARLLQTGYIDKEGVLQLAACFQWEMDKLIVAIEAEEDLMRLTGRWTDNEQEIKEYWMERTQKAIGCTCSKNFQLPMRNE